MSYSKEEKAMLLEGWRQSGKNISAYVRDKGLVRWTFTKWLKAERGSKPCFVEVPAPVKPSMHQAAEILIEKGDVKIHVPLAMSGSELREIVEGLGVRL